MTVDEALAYANTDQYSDDPVVGALAAEVERLRAENAQQRADWATLEAAGNAELDRLRAENASGKKLMVAYVETIQALQTENAKLKQKDSEAAGTLRANVAELQLVEAMRELDWFRRREAHVQEMKGCSGNSCAERAWLELEDWEKANPKPGAGA